MIRHIAVLVTLAIGLALAFAGRSRADKEPRAGNEVAPNAAANVAIRDAAKRAYEMALRQYQAGALNDPEVLYRWSKRWRDAEKANAAPKEARGASAKHVFRMEQLKKDEESRIQAGVGEPGKLAATQYYFLEAKAELNK